MANRTIRAVLADTLEDLIQKDLEKFCHRLVDRREEPRVRRGRVEGKSFLDIADILVSTFTEEGALRVAVEILRAIGCGGQAEALEKEAGGQSSKPAATENEHFVDIHRSALIRRVAHVGNILDELLDDKVLQQESYAKIRALSTSHDKIRELYSVLRASDQCKDKFYESLKRNEPYLIKDLEGKK